MSLFAGTKPVILQVGARCPATVAACALGAMALSTPVVAAPTGWVDHLSSLSVSRWDVDSGWSNGSWMINDWLASQVGTGPRGMVVTLSKNSASPSGYASGEVRTKAFLKYGYYEARMQAAKGAGVDTGFFMYTGPAFGAATWNEIDVEVLGANTHAVSLAYHNGSKQVSTVVNLSFDASAAPHLYAFEWQPKYIKWFVDNRLVLTQTGATVALPSEPQKIYFDMWGSDSLGGWMGMFNWTGRPITTEAQCISASPAYTGKTVC